MAVEVATVSSGHKCSHCSFVANAESIFINWGDRGKISFKPSMIGLFTMPGWLGHSPFYAFICKFCGEQAVDYPHGYTGDGLRNGLLYLICSRCSALHVLYEKRFYEIEGMGAPLTFWQMLMGAIKARFSKV